MLTFFQISDYQLRSAHAQSTFGWRWLPIEDLWTSPPDSTHLKFIKLGTPCTYFVLFTLNFYVPFRINLINSYIIYIIWIICLKKRCKYISFIFSYVWCIYKFIFLNMWILNSYKHYYFNKKFNIFLKFEQLLLKINIIEHIIRKFFGQ